MQRFAEPLRQHRSAGWLVLEDAAVVATREGLLRMDRLLHDYFLDHHRGVRFV